LHHLIKANEITAIQYLAIHNVAFMNRLMEQIRTAIREDNYEAARENWFAT
jgi:tRNA-guanine family transglycosylase